MVVRVVSPQNGPSPNLQNLRIPYFVGQMDFSDEIKLSIFKWENFSGCIWIDPSTDPHKRGAGGSDSEKNDTKADVKGMQLSQAV